MTYVSTTFTGEWPRGIYWTPGETRTIPEDWPVEGEPPEGLQGVEEPSPASASSEGSPAVPGGNALAEDGS